MTARLRLDLPLVLPNVPDARDACVERLIALVERRPGITQAHVVADDGKAPLLCLHYDPDALSLGQVERLAQVAGAEVTDRFGHAILPLHAVDAEDAGRRIEDGLRSGDGVLVASVNLAAELALMSH